ncbi:hypothetical protein L2D08_12340 [Domibacillus sp. PGB-M46]|nr:hypothetical protein [Domibacillus sp. PGB-M46]
MKTGNAGAAQRLMGQTARFSIGILQFPAEYVYKTYEMGKSLTKGSGSDAARKGE